MAREPEFIVATVQGGDHIIFCPACQMGHFFDARWKFNGDKEKPTFTPSLVVTYELGGRQVRCHSWVRDGMIQYCDDSTHELAGKTVPLERF